MPMEQFINPYKLPVIVLGEVPSMQTNYCTYQELLSKSTGTTNPSAEYRDNTCAVIINSSGTTGTPKPIELSDCAINAAVEKMVKTDYPLYERNLLLKIIPSQIGMGLITTLYTGLIIGIPVIYLSGNSPQSQSNCL